MTESEKPPPTGQRRKAGRGLAIGIALGVALGIVIGGLYDRSASKKT